MGLGILVWGFMNSLIAHITFTFIFLEYSPGILTSLIFLLFTVMGFKQVREMGRLSWRLAVLSIVCGLLYWGLPMTLFIEVDKLLRI